ncbi:hypothetical protein NHX12_026919 [Muraenolepis orangiensis]|uniref:PDZ and pleckstrin homology domains 1 n=1 Tax=Muraenolepis orangiensis TaxID=630683 RepID=A0A9Q0EBH0_9TELE|nr:hypothetical protein NHX12_026919 [Muraenolepis orangiensis]
MSRRGGGGAAGGRAPAAVNVSSFARMTLEYRMQVNLLESIKRNCVLKKDKENFNKSGVNFFQEDNVLSVSGEEDKQDGTPSIEKRVKLDHRWNFCESPGKRIQEPEEKRLKIVTSVAVHNLNDSPKIIFQQTQEPLFEDAQCSTFAITNVIRFNCVGSSIEHQNLSGDNKNSKQDTFNCNVSFGSVRAQKHATFVIPARYENHTCCQESYCNTNIKLASLSPPTSYLYPQGTTMSNHTDSSSDQAWDIPPPNEFADMIQDTSLEELTEHLVSLNIDTESSSCKQQSPFQCTQDMDTYEQLSDRLEFLDEGEDPHTPSHSFDQFSESDNFEPPFMRPSLSISRSSFTMDFINKHEQNACPRNNSVSTFQHATCPIQRKRRQTYPGGSDSMQEDLLPFRELFSSGTISPLTIQSLPLQAEKWATFCQEDGIFSFFGTDVKQSSIYDGCVEAIPGNTAKNQTDEQHDVNQYDTETLEKTSDVAFGNIEGQRHAKDPSLTSDAVECLEDSRPSKGRVHGEPVEWSGIDLGCPRAGPAAGQHTTQRALVIQVIPPSPLGSNDAQGAPEEGPPQCVGNRVSWCKAKRKQESQDGGVSALLDSALTITVGSDKTLVSSIDPQSGTEAKDNLDLTSKETDVLAGSERGDLRSPEMQEIQKEVQPTLRTSSPDYSISEHAQTPPGHKDDPRMDQETKERRKQVCKTDTSEKHNVVRASLETQEHVKPTTHKDSDSRGPDHWGQRRKLFKESSQRSSAAGGSVHSDLTEESVSDDTHSMDTLPHHVPDIEGRGFYTATFHYTAWTHCGDDVPAGTSATSLSPRSRPVSIRERTVKISKAMGEYPWGFRIQFSKPIIVTEVDTNSAAEEAGLIVGDYLLAVNGTDVTGLLHFEATELARQGPEILTLTIGSDIARIASKPRPGCRGYLHKRTQSGFIKGWRKRWFVLTHDCCLHYFRHKRDEGRKVALSTVKLEGAEVGVDVSLGKPFVIRCCPQTADRVYFLCATSNLEMKRWLEDHVWVDVTRHNSSLPPLAVKNPECLGLLYEMDRNKDMSRQLYGILKDGCLYFYSSIRSTHALGGMYLHGYMVREQPVGSKKSTIELRPPSDEFKTFYLCAENPDENKRWIEAMKVSINKWHWAMQSYKSPPPEETKA